MKSGKKDRKPHNFTKKTQAQRDARGTRIEKQLRAATVEEMLQGIPTACDLGGKQGNNGQTKWWRGYKLHLDVASVPDSQVAIPLIQMTSDRVTFLYDVIDSAYHAKSIQIRVRGAKKVMAQLMFGVLALTVDQLPRLHP